MVEVWRDPGITRGESDLVRRRGLVMKDGVEGKGIKRPPVVSGKDREGSARNKADEEWEKMFGGRK